MLGRSLVDFSAASGRGYESVSLCTLNGFTLRGFVSVLCFLVLHRVRRHRGKDPENIVRNQRVE
jgi:hypothetical protein